MPFGIPLGGKERGLLAQAQRFRRLGDRIPGADHVEDGGRSSNDLQGITVFTSNMTASVITARAHESAKVD
jgi:hypothetical protein